MVLATILVPRLNACSGSSVRTDGRGQERRRILLALEIIPRSGQPTVEVHRAISYLISEDCHRDLPSRFSEAGEEAGLLR